MLINPNLVEKIEEICSKIVRDKESQDFINHMRRQDDALLKRVVS